jgi:hypothetical protein
MLPPLNRAMLLDIGRRAVGECDSCGEGELAGGADLGDTEALLRGARDGRGADHFDRMVIIDSASWPLAGLPWLVVML